MELFTRNLLLSKSFSVAPSAYTTPIISDWASKNMVETHTDLWVWKMPFFYVREKIYLFWSQSIFLNIGPGQIHFCSLIFFWLNNRYAILPAHFGFPSALAGQTGNFPWSDMGCACEIPGFYGHKKLLTRLGSKFEGSFLYT